MTAIKCEETELLTVLEKNRENHHAIFLEAQEGYRTLAIAEIEHMLEDARGGKKFARVLTLTVPMDQTKDYDMAIGMLRMSVDEYVTLEEEDYKCYVLDQWRWKQQFSTSNRGYSKSLRDQED